MWSSPLFWQRPGGYFQCNEVVACVITDQSGIRMPDVQMCNHTAQIVVWKTLIIWSLVSSVEQSMCTLRVQFCSCNHAVKSSRCEAISRSIPPLRFAAKTICPQPAREHQSVIWRQIATAGCYGWSLRIMMMMIMIWCKRLSSTWRQVLKETT